jgi:hypothetical protein
MLLRMLVALEAHLQRTSRGTSPSWLETLLLGDVGYQYIV